MPNLDEFTKNLKPGSYSINSKTCKCTEVLDANGNQIFFESNESGIESKSLEVEESRPYGTQLSQGSATTLAEKDHIIETMRQQRNKIRQRDGEGLEWAKKMYSQGKIGRISAQKMLDNFNFSNRDRRLVWPLPAIVTFDEAFGA